MRKFILVDHSLRDTGGHHYPYAASVLQAAEDAGFAPALATHRDFRMRSAFPAHWPLLALFPQVSYSAHALDTQAAPKTSRSLRALLAAPWRELWRQRQRQLHIHRFAATCHDLFQALTLNPGDVVFFPTASELDLQGLGMFVARAQPLPEVHWHAQLHFGIHRERDWRQHGDTRAAADMKSSLLASLQQCCGIKLSLWCTTEPLADQYRALGVAEFATLPYPVHPSFSALRQLRTRPHPARIACLGHARREKNQRALPALLGSLWDEAFAVGRAQLVVQNARPALRAALVATVQRLAAGAPAAAQTDALDCTAGTLDQEQYARLVCGSDIGLLLYDARRYHDRCSGVLLEMLVAGVPVVVPARSWLSEQIAAANQAWLQHCATDLLEGGRLRPLTPAADGSLEIPADSHGVLIDVELTDTDDTGITVDMTADRPPGTGRAGRQLWLDAPRGQRRCLRLLPLPGRCQRLELRATRPLTINAVAGPLPPLGSVGLAIESPADAADALRDILDHIEHYKHGSAQQAARCAEDCSSAHIVRQLGERA